MTPIVTRLERAQILRGMLPANMGMRSVDRTLQLRPEALDPVRRNTPPCEAIVSS